MEDPTRKNYKLVFIIDLSLLKYCFKYNKNLNSDLFLFLHFFTKKYMQIYFFYIMSYYLIKFLL